MAPKSKPEDKKENTKHQGWITNTTGKPPLLKTIIVPLPKAKPKPNLTITVPSANTFGGLGSPKPY